MQQSHFQFYSSLSRTVEWVWILCHRACYFFFLQFEITPFNVMYQSLIINPYLNGSDLEHDLVNCSTSGVQSFVQASNASHTWLADVRLPWSLVSNTSGPGEEPSFGPISPVWRINLFRVLMLDDVDFCTPSTCAYGALSPTFANPPAFHIPTFFAVMVLE